MRFVSIPHLYLELTPVICYFLVRIFKFSHYTSNAFGLWLILLPW
jgi:hypothetical protein